jgi:hypothetical protein
VVCETITIDASGANEAAIKRTTKRKGRWRHNQRA